MLLLSVKCRAGRIWVDVEIGENWRRMFLWLLDLEIDWYSSIRWEAWRSLFWWIDTGNDFIWIKVTIVGNWWNVLSELFNHVNCNSSICDSHRKVVIFKRETLHDCVSRAQSNETNRRVYISTLPNDINHYSEICWISWQILFLRFQTGECCIRAGIGIENDRWILLWEMSNSLNFSSTFTWNPFEW